MKSLFIYNALLLAVVFAMIQFSVSTSNVDQKKTDHIPALALQGRMAAAMTIYDTPQDFPNFVFKTALDKALSMDDLKGQWVIVNFWATWCPPCLVEMPSLQQAQDKWAGQGLRIVAISLDRQMTAAKLRDFIADKGFGPIAAHYDAEGRIMRELKLRGLPTSYILAPNGKAIAVFEGDTDWTDADSDAFIASLLAPAQP